MDLVRGPNWLEDSFLASRVAERAGGYFALHLRRVRVVKPRELDPDRDDNLLLDPQLEDNLWAHLTDIEVREVLLLDVLVRGQPRQRPDLPQVWLAVEAALEVDQAAVERANRRAALLRRAGYSALPVVVVGERLTPDAEAAAAAAKVVVVREEGPGQNWDAALAAL